MKRIKQAIFIALVLVLLAPNFALALGKEFGDGKRFEEEVAPPYIVSVSPVDGEQNVSLDSNVKINFNEKMVRALVEAGFNISPWLTGQLVYECTTRYTFYPKEGLICGTTYTVRMSGSAQSRASGLVIGSDYVWSFRTAECDGQTTPDQDDGDVTGDTNDTSGDETNNDTNGTGDNSDGETANNDESSNNNNDTSGSNQQGGTSGGSSGASATSGGSGGYIPYPQVDLEYNYAPQKWVGNEYLENIKVLNIGGAVLTNGELVLDLPEEYVEFVASNPTQASVDKESQIIRWQVPSIGMDYDWSVNFVVKAKESGGAFSLAGYSSDQVDKEIKVKEEIAKLAAEKEVKEIVENISKPVVEKPIAVVDGSITTVTDQTSKMPAAIKIEVDGQQTDEIEDGMDRETILPASIEVPGEVAGVVDVCRRVAWWVWLLVIILHFAGLIVYYYYTVPEDEIMEAENRIKIVKGTWGFLHRLLIVLALIFLLFKLVSQIKLWWLVALVLILYFAALAVIYTLIRKAEKRDWVMAPVLTLAMVIVPAIACENFRWTSWVILALFLALIFATYYYFVSNIKTRRLWALLPFWLTIFVLIIEVLIAKCLC